MATEAGFAGNHFQESDTIKRRANSNVNKRKRESLDVGLSSTTRVAPTTRRTSSQYTAPAPPQQETEQSPETDDSTMADLGNESFQQSGTNGGGGGGGGGVSGEDSNAQFDFALQPSTSGTQTSQPAATGEAGTGVNVDTAAAALSQHYSMTVPRHPAEAFANEPTIEPEGSISMDSGGVQIYESATTGALSLTPFDGSAPGSMTQRILRKAPVGSEEWHKVRKDNHKEVERRRRETINEGINELSKIVPGCEKNKGSILQRAVQYIAKLHDEASQNIDKWTFEKLVTEQAINELSAKLSRAWAEKEAWKRLAREAGVNVDTVDLGVDVSVSGGAEAAAGGAAAGTGMATGAASTAASSSSSAATTGSSSGEQGQGLRGGSTDEEAGVQLKQGQVGDEAA